MPVTVSKTITLQKHQGVGRNDPCYCGSGKKYKKCCLTKDEATRTPGKEGLITVIVSYLTKQERFSTLMQKRLQELYPKGSTIEENQLQALTETVIFADKLEGKQTPLAYFITHAPLSAEQKAYYQTWLNQTIFSLFEVLTIAYGTSVAIRDIVTNNEYVVSERTGTYGLSQGVLIAARIVPHYEQFMFTGGTFAVFPKEAGYLLKQAKGKELAAFHDQLAFSKAYLAPKKGRDDLFAADDEANIAGPLEEMLTQQAIEAGIAQHFERFGKHEAEKRMQAFTHTWFITPQKALDNKTPKQVILEERKHLGNQDRDVGITMQLEPTERIMPDEQAQQYNEAIQLIRKHDDYQALQLLAAMKAAMPENERFRWFTNAGIALAGLGEVELATKYFAKSVALQPDYAIGKQNVQAYTDETVQAREKRKGMRRRFSQVLQQKLVNVDNTLLKQTTIIADTKAFLTHIRYNPVGLMKVKRDIQLRDIELLNRHFAKPDPQMTILKGTKDSFKHREEVEFTKVHFLRCLAEHSHLVKASGQKLILTKKGAALLELDDVSVYRTLLSLWLTAFPWTTLLPKQGYFHLIEPIDKLVQELFYDITNALLQQGNNAINTLDLFKDLLHNVEHDVQDLQDQDPTASREFLSALLFIAFQARVLPILLWFGLVKKKEGLRLLPKFHETTTTKITLTPLGKSLFQQVTDSMATLIPEVFYELA